MAEQRIAHETGRPAFHDDKLLACVEHYLKDEPLPPGSEVFEEEFLPLMRAIEAPNTGRSEADFWERFCGHMVVRFACDLVFLLHDRAPRTFVAVEKMDAFLSLVEDLYGPDRVAVLRGVWEAASQAESVDARISALNGFIPGGAA